jgi:hypothetical protein
MTQTATKHSHPAISKRTNDPYMNELIAVGRATINQMAAAISGFA